MSGARGRSFPALPAFFWGCNVKNRIIAMAALTMALAGGVYGTALYGGCGVGGVCGLGYLEPVQVAKADYYDDLNDGYDPKTNDNTPYFSDTSGNPSEWDFTSLATRELWDYNGRGFYEYIVPDYLVGTYRLLYDRFDYVINRLTNIDSHITSGLGLVNRNITDSVVPALWGTYDPSGTGSAVTLWQMLYDWKLSLEDDTDYISTQLGNIYTRLGQTNGKLDTQISSLASLASSLASVYSELGQMDMRLLSIQNNTASTDNKTITQWLKQIATNGISASPTDLLPVNLRLDAIIALLMYDDTGIDDAVEDFDLSTFDEGVQDLAERAEDKYPYALVHDAYDLIDVVNAEPVAPVFNFYLPYMNNNLPFVLDLRSFDALRRFSTLLCYMALVMTLVFLTRRYGATV